MSSLKTLRGKSRAEQLVLLAAAVTIATGAAEASVHHEAAERLLSEVDRRVKNQVSFPEEERMIRRLQYLDRQMTSAALGGPEARRSASQAVSESGLLSPRSLTLDKASNAGGTEFLGEGTRWADVEKAIESPAGYEYFIASDPSGEIGPSSAVGLVVTAQAAAPNGAAAARIVIAKIHKGHIVVGEVFMAFADEPWFRERFDDLNTALESPTVLFAEFALVYGSDFKVGDDDETYRFLPHKTVTTALQPAPEGQLGYKILQIKTTEQVRLKAAGIKMWPPNDGPSSDSVAGTQFLSMFGVVSVNEQEYHRSLREHGVAVTR